MKSITLFSERSTKILLFAALTAQIILVAYWGALINFEGMDYLFYGATSIVLFGWVVRRRLGTRGVCVSVLLSWVVVVALLYPKPFEFLGTLAIIIGPPAAVYWLCRKFHLPKWTFGAALTLCLWGDLFHYMKTADFLFWDQQPPSAIAEGFDPRIKTPSSPQSRLAGPPVVVENPNQGPGQGIRYIELLLGKPFVFSSRIEPARHGERFLPALDSFEKALSQGRWNSFFLPKSYFNLIHSGIHPSVLREMFAVGEPPFQFKVGVVPVSDDQLRPFFDNLGPDKSITLLQSYVVMAPPLDPSLAGFVRNPNEAGRVSPGSHISLESRISSSVRVPLGAGDNPDNPLFRYEIRNYEPDSFILTAESPQDGILYWADGYDRWWKAYSRGNEIPIFRANADFKALILSKGVNAIRLVYSPVPFRISLWIYYAVFLGSVIAALASYFFSKEP